MAGGKLISTGVEFPDATTQTTSGLPLTGGTMTGALTTTGFTSTGIDDNATSTAITIDASENVGIGTTTPAGFEVRDKVIRISKDASTTAYRILGNDLGNDLAFQSSDSADGSTYTSRLNIMSDGRGLSQFTAKAWIYFDGTGTPSIFDSHNVSSITDSAVGAWNVNFSNSMADANYSVIGMSAKIISTGAQQWAIQQYRADNVDRFTADVRAIDNDGHTFVVYDSNNMSAVVFGD